MSEILRQQQQARDEFINETHRFAAYSYAMLVSMETADKKEIPLTTWKMWRNRAERYNQCCLAYTQTMID